MCIRDRDFVVELPHDICPHCAASLKDIKTDEIKTRQVFDIPEIKINVTEYQEMCIRDRL